MPIHVRSSFSQKEGTWVVRAEDVSAGGAQGTEEAGSTMVAAIITAVEHDSSQAKITIVGVPDTPGEAAAIFSTVADAQINIDMLVQNISAAATGRTDISFTLPRGAGQTAMAALAGMPDQVGQESLQYDDSVGTAHGSG